MAKFETFSPNPNVRVATLTLQAIESTIQADQGSSFRGFLGQVIPHMGDAYRTGEDGFRTHMGASLIGGECPRAIWYGFNWALKPKFKGQTLRLFNRGHLEEARMIACLLTIGCRVFQQDANGKQFRISDMGGHYGGSGDGVGIDIPDLPPGTPALLEFKTHNDKSFSELKAKGVREAKFEHYVQMNQYMPKMGLPAALYLAVNKNTDELYGEILLPDTANADEYLDHARKIVPIRSAPSKMNESPGFFKCKWCDYHKICHYGAAPERNCRTCMWSRPDTEDGTWKCDNKERQTQLLFPDTNPNNENYTLTKERQLTGCEHYGLNPTFLP